MHVKTLDTLKERCYDACRPRLAAGRELRTLMRSFFLRWMAICLLCGLAALAASCAAKQGQGGLLDYSRSAKELYDSAMEQFDDEDCVEAEKLFEDVRRQFPYSKYAPESELRLADCKLSQGNNAEAAVAFEQFVKAHPTHKDADYAAYKRGVAFYEMIPGDWLIMPPPYERDQSATRDARAAFASFLKNYPESVWKDRARDYLVEVVDALVRHEMYVAQFYLSRGLRKAASVRLEGIWVSFPESSLVPDAMFLQATTFLEMGEDAEAKRIFEEIAKVYPRHYQTKRAMDYLRHMEARAGRAD
jgi:outer membrane protein assembly factor BamD